MMIHIVRMDGVRASLPYPLLLLRYRNGTSDGSLFTPILRRAIHLITATPFFQQWTKPEWRSRPIEWAWKWASQRQGG